MIIKASCVSENEWARVMSIRCACALCKCRKMCMIQIDQMAPFRPPNYFTRIFHLSSISVNTNWTQIFNVNELLSYEPNIFTNDIELLRSNSNESHRIKRNKSRLSALSRDYEKKFTIINSILRFNAAVVVPLFAVRMTIKMNWWRTLAHFHFIGLHKQHK